MKPPILHRIEAEMRPIIAEKASRFTLNQPSEERKIRATQSELLPNHRLPTNTTTDQHPIHRWFNFIAGFSPEFVDLCCEAASLGKSETLLDPFAGCGTAPLVARQRGCKSVGFEAHPVFARIARAKLPSSNTIARLDMIESVLLASMNKESEPVVLEESATAFLEKLFTPPTLGKLLNARKALHNAGLDSDDLAFLILSRVVEECSHSQTDGIYKAPDNKKRCLSPEVAARKIITLLRTDLDLADNQWSAMRPSADIYDHTSENMSEIKDGSISIVVTSPPYLNNFDYAEMTRMLLYFWEMASSWGEITAKVRSRLIVNTTTALRGHKNRQEEYRQNVTQTVRFDLDALVLELCNRKKLRAGKKEYDFLIFPYFSQMTNVLKECYRCMKAGAPIHIMVADAALYGVHISTPQILSKILSDIGFSNVRCDMVRQRGHRWVLAKREGSQTGLGEYHVSGFK